MADPAIFTDTTSTLAIVSDKRLVNISKDVQEMKDRKFKGLSSRPEY
jgi:hypothetical protein